MKDEVEDEEYLTRLEEGYLTSIREFKPELVCYVAGAEPHHSDQLGGLRLTTEGLERRDRLVIQGALEATGAPVAIVLAGGYSKDVRDTVTIHCNTARVAMEAMG